VAPIDAYRRTSDLPAEIAVFPLRGAILLPRARLPLNVFEPRYLAMLDDVVSGTRVLGIIQPGETGHGTPESPEGSSLLLKRIGCAGRVTAYQELDDGRLMISLTGVCRFETVTEISNSQPFRTFSVDYTPFANDLKRGEGEQSVDRQNLLRVLKSYLDANRLDADWDAISNAPTEMLINSLSVISPFGPEEKQALLEARDLKTRAEVLATLAEMELATDDRSGGQVQ
jgi:uncharacterized protein